MIHLNLVSYINKAFQVMSKFLHSLGHQKVMQVITAKIMVRLSVLDNADDLESTTQAASHLFRAIEACLAVGKEVSLAAHSKGSEIVMRVVQMLNRASALRHLFLFAADISHEEWKLVHTSVLHLIDQGVTIFYNQKDPALLASSAYWGGVERVGSAALGTCDYERSLIVDASCLEGGHGYVRHETVREIVRNILVRRLTYARGMHRGSACDPKLSLSVFGSCTRSLSVVGSQQLFTSRTGAIKPWLLFGGEEMSLLNPYVDWQNVPVEVEEVVWRRTRARTNLPLELHNPTYDVLHMYGYLRIVTQKLHRQEEPSNLTLTLFQNRKQHFQYSFLPNGMSFMADTNVIPLHWFGIAPGDLSGLKFEGSDVYIFEVSLIGSCSTERAMFCDSCAPQPQIHDSSDVICKYHFSSGILYSCPD